MHSQHLEADILMMPQMYQGSRYEAIFEDPQLPKKRGSPCNFPFSATFEETWNVLLRSSADIPLADLSFS